MNPVSVPDLRIGDPVQCGALEVFPLYPERTLFSEPPFDYLLSNEAQAAGCCVVREMQEPKVGEVLAKNTGDHSVLFVEGEELCQGGKQNRVLRSSVLIGARSEAVLPVFCVERGRWSSPMGNLKTGSHAPPSLRYLLKQGTQRTGIFGQRGGQVEVWRFIMSKHLATATRSPRHNMSDIFVEHPTAVQELRREIRYPEGASGIVIVVNGRTVGIDLFDQPGTLQKLWDRLVVLGTTFDYLDIDREENGEEKPVRVYADRIRSMRWREFATVGLGKLLRAIGDDGSLGAALVADGALLHLSVSFPCRRHDGEGS